MPGLFLLCHVQRLTWYLGNFLKFLGGGVVGVWDCDFEKFDLRVRNSVYVLTIGPPQFGVVGDGWGQRNSQLNRLLASLFSPIVCKLDLSLREIALVTSQPIGD